MTGTTQLILSGVVRVQAQSQPSSSSQPLVTNWGAYEPDSSIGKPGRREGGGTRNPCFKGSITVTALIPLVKFQGKQLAYGTTFEASPTFFAYVPPAYVPLSEQENSSAEELSKSRQVEFLLQQQEENKEIYRATFTVPASAGIVSISLPTYENSPTLEVGKNYVWSVSLICDAETYKADPSDNSIKISGLGSIKRVNPEASLQMQLKEASPRERFLAYARKGIWYDALSTLAELRRANPNNPQLEADWREMLKSIQLDNITQEPIVPTDSPSQR
ncbi:MAG TPA: DUF928 domain-containing protein [Leptolyngbyaceae cyanobacterium]